jgi:uncharacterized membrane protein YkvA (DUF1232 family)
MPDGRKSKTKELLLNISILYTSLSDPDVPWYVKLLVTLIVAYIISPIDLIPDFIPVFGFLDEVILIPIALTLALKLMPIEVMQKYKNSEPVEFSKSLMSTGIVIVLLLWILVMVTTISILKA